MKYKVGEIKELRNHLPDNWVWHKCYELAYVNTRTGHEFVKKHWALTAEDKKGPVFSLGLISHDNHSNRQEFFDNDLPVQWVEKSLKIVDSLLSEIENYRALYEQEKALVKILHSALNMIAESPSPCNEREFKIWEDVSRDEAIKAIIKYEQLKQQYGQDTGTPR